MKNLSLFTLILIAILLPLIADAQKYVGTYYGGALGISNAPPNIATNGAGAANGTILQKTGDKLQLTATVSNLNIGTGIITAVYGPYTNLAGYWNAEGRFVGTNTVRVATNWVGLDGVWTTFNNQMYFAQGASGIFNFGQGTVPGLSDGHVIAQDFTGSGAALTGINGPFTNAVDYGSLGRTNWGVMTNTGFMVTNTDAVSHYALYGPNRITYDSDFTMYFGTSLNGYWKAVGGLVSTYDFVCGQGAISIGDDFGGVTPHLSRASGDLLIDGKNGSGTCNLIVQGRTTSTNGYVFYQRQTIPTNSIPPSSSGVTNFVLVNLTNNIGSAISGGIYYVATNIAASGSFILRKPTMTEAAWP